MIYVVTHKAFDDSFLDKEHYQVLQVGNGPTIDNSMRDNTGDHIAGKNASYCELTGLYWVWKNGQEAANDFVGLTHYRRYFTTKTEAFLYAYFGKMPSVLSFEKIEEELKQSEIILPTRMKAFHSVEDIYKVEHIGEDIQLLREIILDQCPGYRESFERVMNGREYWYANMMILTKRRLDAYCNWLFPILEALETKIDMNKHNNAYQSRVYGFLAERLLNVWVRHEGLRIKEFPVFNTEIKSETIFIKNWQRIKRLIKG